VSEYSSPCIDMRADDVLISADPDVREQTDRTISRTQITPFGVTSGGHPADQVAGRSGGSGPCPAQKLVRRVTLMYCRALRAGRERTRESRHGTAVRRMVGRMNSPIRGFLTSFRVQVRNQGNLTSLRVQVPPRTPNQMKSSQIGRHLNTPWWFPQSGENSPIRVVKSRLGRSNWWGIPHTHPA
jgi:hypothetical protein